jgi:prepilin-type N-terminal cleavage/methylation domain-containing protein
MKRWIHGLATLKNSKENSKGFTLIELLVVIAIIGILASIILASLSTAQAKGRDARRISDIKQIQLALSLYYDANNYYPVSIYGNPSPLVQGGYISVMPYDPKGTGCATGSESTGCYTYIGLCPLGGVCSAASINSYHLGTSLESPTNNSLSNAADVCPGGTAGTACSSPYPLGSVHDGPANNSGAVAADFSGLSAQPGGSPCSLSPGTPYPGTQTCYDVTP